MRATDNLFSVI